MSCFDYAGSSGQQEEVWVHPSSIAHGTPTAAYRAPFLVYLEKVGQPEGDVLYPYPY